MEKSNYIRFSENYLFLVFSLYTVFHVCNMFVHRTPLMIKLIELKVYSVAEVGKCQFTVQRFCATILRSMLNLKRYNIVCIIRGLREFSDFII